MTYTSDDTAHGEGYLAGQLLVAMPQMLDERFAKTVIYMCAHTEDGAMGLVVNKVMENIDFPDLLDQLGLSPSPAGDDIRVHFGGPVESGRGFVLHSSDYVQDATMVIDESIAMTATTDILRDIAEGDGPRNSLLALGYAGWGPGQLDSEIQANGWLSVPADATLIFGTDPNAIWQGALAKIGIDVSMLSGDAGHA
jgi:putative transcriptional regulator